MKSLTISRFVHLDYATNEAMNTLCTNLSFMGSSVRKIVVTSCQPGEGKSFVTMNLMRTLSRMGKTVVLVDADLRRSMLAPQYGILFSDQTKAAGLSHYLAGYASVEDVLYETNIPNAYMIVSGKDVVNSLSLLNTPRLSALLDSLSKSFDYVLVDGPPIGIIIDAAEIAKFCDGVLFVVSNNTVSRRELVEAKAQVEKSGCPILGTVLNKVSFDTRSAKRYYHKTYYSQYNNTSYAEPVSRKKGKNDRV